MMTAVGRGKLRLARRAVDSGLVGLPLLFHMKRRMGRLHGSLEIRMHDVFDARDQGSAHAVRVKHQDAQLGVVFERFQQRGRARIPEFIA